MSSQEVIRIIAAPNGGFSGEAPGKQIAVTPVSDEQALFTLSKWRQGDAGDLVEVVAVERYRVTVEPLPREDSDPVPPPEPAPEPDPVEAAIAELDAQLPPETSPASVAEVSVPATRVVLNAARTAR